MLQGLIKEKTRYFKKRVLQQLNTQSKEASNSREKTLKYSKSLENFQMLQNKGQPPPKPLLKTSDEELWADRTEIQGRSQVKLEQLVEQLREEVELYRKKVSHL